MENNDLLNLCRLNLMEENIKANTLVDAVEKKEVLQGVEHKKKILASRLIETAPHLTHRQVKKHIEEFAINGNYPPTDEDLWLIEEEK